MTRDDYELYGRACTTLKGEALPQSRLNSETVRAIRINRNGRTPKQWAALLGVHYRTVEKVIYRQTWRHV